MINQNLHKQAVALDRVKHRTLKLDTTTRDLTTMRDLNAVFVAAGEFAEACKDHPLVFVHAGKDEAGKEQVAPVAVFGLQAGQNLCVEGEGWRVRYVPAVLRTYPFAMARAGADQLVLCIDESWKGFGQDKGDALFDEQGEPSAFTRQVQQQLEVFEQDVERTRQVCGLLWDKGLLREMRFDATLPDGRKLAVDGFLTVDEEKLRALPDAEVLAMHKNGVLGLINVHLVSLGNMRRLVEWHLARYGATPPNPVPAPAAMA